MYKCGDRENRGSYASVGLISTMLKNLEMAIRDRIINDLEANSLVMVMQHGCSH